MEVLIILVTVIANVLLGLTTYLKNPRSATNKLFAILTLILSLWSITNYFSLHASNEHWTLFWIRVVMAITSPMGPVIYLLVHTFPRHRLLLPKRSLLVIIFFTLLSIVLSPSPWMFTSVSLEGGITPTPGPAIGVFAGVFFSTVIASFFTIIKKYRGSKGLEKVQIKFLLMGVIATFSINGITNFIFVVLFKQSNLVWLGPTSTLLLAGFIAYAILKHRFMDIGYFVSRAVGYVLLLAFSGLVYMSFLFVSSAFFFGTQLDIATTAVNASAAFLLAISFSRLSVIVQRITARFLYKSDYDIQKVLHQLALVVGSKSSTKSMLDGVQKVLSKRVFVDTVSFIVIKDGQPVVVSKQVQYSDEFLNMLKDENESVYFDELDESEQKKLFRQFDVSVVVPLKIKNKRVGFMILSQKLSGNIYTSKDILLFETFAPNLAVAIDSLQHAEQEYQHLKTISESKSKFITLAGHKFRTPLSSINWNVELLESGELGKLTERSLTAVKAVHQNAESLVRLVNELIEVQALEDGTYVPQVALAAVSPLIAVRSAISASQEKIQQLKLDVSLENNLQPGMKVFVERGKFIRIIEEIIRNAVIYNTDEGSIVVTLHQERKKVVVVVADTGKGISKSELANVFTKFYRGNEGFLADTEGVGIGLYLTKFYVESWGGTISLDSVAGAGTKVVMSFPLAE